jgi:DNA-directed RNA polymerase subunit M
MEFCPKCKSLMIPCEEGMKCRKCGFVKPKKSKLVTTMEEREREVPVVEEEMKGTLPTTQTKCPECGNNTAYWWTRQLRSADEPEVRFFKCTSCGKVWREYS